MLRIRRLAVAVATATALMITGCAKAGGSSAGSDGATGTITYFTFSAAPDHLTDLQKIVDAFQQQNPGITVKVQTAAYDNYFTALQTQIAGNNAPDTFELNYENFVTYAKAGALLAVDGQAKADKDFSADRVYPQAYQAFHYKNKLYALPATFSDVVLIYNKKLFDAAGMSYPTAAWTWADEKAAAAKLTNKAAGVYGDFQPVTFFEFYKALAQAGGSFLSPDGTKATFNDAKGVTAAQWLLDKPGTTMPTVAEVGGKANFDTALFTSGKLAMWHNGIWQFDALNKAGVDYDVAVEPGGTSKASAVFMNATAVSAKTSHAAAAWKWLRFLSTSDTTVATRLASSWELPAVNDKTAFAAYLQKNPPANRQAVFDSLNNIALPPVVAKQQQLQDIVTQALEKVASGQAGLQQALDDAVAKVSALL
jgi:multiple sugar transport system substrate-binding protein